MTICEKLIIIGSLSICQLLFSPDLCENLLRTTGRQRIGNDQIRGIFVQSQRHHQLS